MSKIISLKSFIKKILPEKLKRILVGINYGWHGNFKSWKYAEKHCTGYDSDNILQKVKEATQIVLNGEAAYERDSVVFKNIDYSFEFLTSILWIASQNKGNLSVLDFGGSLGSSYIQNKRILETLPNVKWCIVEQEKFVKEGKLLFKNDCLQFYYSIDACISEHNINVVILSSVMQYLESPYELLELIYSKNIDFLLIDRTAFFDKPDRITIQKVNPSIYNASYPCWFFNKKKFLNFMQYKFDLILTFKSKDFSNVKSEFLGFLFKRKTSFHG